MKDSLLEKKVISILSADLQLKKAWSQRPSVALIPSGGNRDFFYILISLCLSRKSVALEPIAYASIETLRLLIPSGLAKGFTAIEIVPYLENNGKMTKVFRISVKTTAFGAAQKLTASDLLLERPAEGITCGWYVTKPADNFLAHSNRS